MTRLLSTIRWDMQLQLRYGFYYAALFVAIIYIALAGFAPDETLRLLIPPFLLTDLMMTTFYFVAGLVLLEKAQQTLAGLVVTPLRQSEYLTAKVVSLTILALLEGGLIVALGYGFGLNWLWLLLGVVLMAAIYTLLGFVTVSRFDSINEFLFPSAIPIFLLALPLIDYFGLWRSAIFYLIPTQAPLLLIKAAFQPVAAWEIAYGLLYSIVWIGLGFCLSRRAFYHFVMQK